MADTGSAGGQQVDWERVATLEELWEGDVLQVEAGSDSVLVAHLPGGLVKAYQAVCPHAEYPLEAGELEGAVLVCAGHGWEFDLTTGQGLNPDNCWLYAFAVRIDGEQILVAVPRDGNRHYHRCRDRAGPASTTQARSSP